MKIDNIGQIKEVEHIQIISEYTAPKFVEGQILIAQVEHIQGDKVMLKNNEGRLFMALMQSDLGLAEGNIVEVAANSNGSGYVLHLLDVESGNMQSGKSDAARYMIPGTLEAMKANPGMDPKAASFLIENNIPRTPQNIATLAQIVRGDSGLGALLAGILSGLDNTDVQPAPGAQAVPAGATEAQAGQATGYIDEGNLSQPNATGGQAAVPAGQAADGAGQAAAAESAAQAGGSPQVNGAVESAVISESKDGAGAAGMQSQAAAANAPQSQNFGAAIAAQTQNSAEAAETAQGQNTAQPAAAAQTQGQQQANASAPGNIPEQANIPAAQNTQYPVNAPANLVSEAAPQVILNEGIYVQDIYVMNENATGEQTAAAAAEPKFAEKDIAALIERFLSDMPGQPRSINKEEIAGRIMDLFCRPDKQTGAEFKKTILDIPDGLNTLKLLLQQSDKQDKGALIQKADQAQKQLELLAESKRFDCIQVPFMLKNGAERTAELYVYRHKRNNKEPGEEGLTVLVALDTQHIGRVETLMKTAGKKLSLEFRLERKEIQPEIIKRSKALAKALESAGYTLKSLKITGLETKTTVINAGGVLITDAGVSPGNIDVQI